MSDLSSSTPERWQLAWSTDRLGCRSENLQYAYRCEGANVPDDCDGLILREDRVTDQDVERVARRLAQIDGEEADYECNAGQARDYHQEHARELLALVLGGDTNE